MKNKSSRSLLKRFLKKNNNVKYKKSNMRHLLTKKSSKLKRHLGKVKMISVNNHVLIKKYF